MFGPGVEISLFVYSLVWQLSRVGSIQPVSLYSYFNPCAFVGLNSNVSSSLCHLLSLYSLFVTYSAYALLFLAILF